MIEDVILLAYELHKDDKYGDLPYMRHLNDVYDLTVKYALPEYVQHAAWLHDGPEMHPEQIGLIFSDAPSIACWRLVSRVTDVAGETRSERKEKTFANIAGDDMAIALKLCDLCANLGRSVDQFNYSKLKMYVKEHELVEKYFFSIVLRSRDWRIDELWSLYRFLIRKAKYIITED